MIESDLPRVLAFYRDTWDDDGTAVGWRTVAWGLALPNGAAVTVPLDGPPSATLWSSLGDAAEALDAYVDAPAPARRLDDEARPDPGVRASTTSSLRLSSGSDAAQPACPPAVAASGEDRPLGRDQSGAER